MSEQATVELDAVREPERNQAAGRGGRHGSTCKAEGGTESSCIGAGTELLASTASQHRLNITCNTYLHMNCGRARNNLTPQSDSREKRSVPDNHSELRAARDGDVSLVEATQPARVHRTNTRDK